MLKMKRTFQIFLSSYKKQQQQKTTNYYHKKISQESAHATKEKLRNKAELFQNFSLFYEELQAGKRL